MRYTFKDIDNGGHADIFVEGKKFEISITDHSQYGDFVSVMIRDPYLEDTFFANGIYETHGYRFMFRWDSVYDINRDNWIHNNTLIVDVL